MNLHRSPFTLEDVVINSKLRNRPSKVPNYEAENQALIILAQTLANAPDTILQRLAETALQLCRADTAGISLLDDKDGAAVFRWEALAGVFSDRRNSTMPRYASPCGTTIDRNATQLMYMAERVFPALRSDPPVVEALLIPFHVGGQPIGTVWVVAHDERRQFDREDERIITMLARFASAAWQLWQARTGAETAAKNERQRALELARANTVLQAHLASRIRVEEQLEQLTGELPGRFAEGRTELTGPNADLAKDFRNELRRSEMITNIGTLTASIAHDFNNILHVIQAHAALIMSQPGESKNAVEHARMIGASVEQGAVLARQLVAVGRKTETNLELTDINALLQRTTELLIPIFPISIVIAADLDSRAPMIMVDAGLMNQALLNLCINARDAMVDGGKLLLRTRIISAADLRRESFPEARSERYVCLSVADTGVGMTSAVRSRVFESYFTTKKPGQGSGLGLSIVQGIVSEHGGFIEVTSEPGCGSTFHLYLPIRGNEAAPITDPPGQDNLDDRTRRCDTVLYAEDEVRLSDLMRILLEREGYRVLIAQDGAEAVAVHARYKNEIAVAILDSGLDKLNGWEAFQRMKQINPKLKGIIASGYLSAEVESRLAAGELHGVLQKPFVGNEVLATIKRAIQS